MSLAVLADHMASKGRGPDSMLIHMSPREVQGLQALAMAHGGSLTVNPDTGLPEAGFLDKLLPTILGAGLTFMGVPPNVSAMIVGGIQTVRTGDLGKGIQAGLGAYGGANLTSSMTAAGGSAIGSEAAGQSYLSNYAPPGVLEGAGGVGAGLSADMAYNLADAGVSTLGEGAAAANQAATSAVEAASPYEKLSRGFGSATDQLKSSPMQYLKDNAKNLSYAFGPAILAEMGAKQNMPQTVTKPGMITPYSFFGGQYVPGQAFQATPTRAANGGLMGLAAGGMAGYGDGDDVPRRNDNGMAQGGMYDFAQRSEPVVRMADGGIAGYAAGGYTQEQINAALAAELGARGGTSQADLTNYAKSQYGLTDAQINAAYDTIPGFNAQGKYDAADYMATSKPGQVSPQMVVDAAAAANPYSAQNMAKVDITRPGHYVQDASGNYVALSGNSPGFDINNPTALTYLGELSARGGTDSASQYFNQVATPAQKAESARLYGIEKARLDALDVAAGRLPDPNAVKAPTGLAGLNQNLLADTSKPPTNETPAARDARLFQQAGGDWNKAAALRTAEDAAAVADPNYWTDKKGLAALDPGASYTTKWFAERGLGFDPIDKVIDNFLVKYKTELDAMLPKEKEAALRAALAKEKLNEADVIKATGKTIAQLSVARRADDSIIVPGNLKDVPVGTLPGGVSGAGKTVINENGTITTRPDIPGIEDGFTGMKDVRDTYVEGGGSLGYTSPTYASLKAVEDKYPLRGAAKKSYDYLMGREDYDPIPYTKDGQISKSYNESVMKLPKASASKMYIFQNGKFVPNPDYAIPTYDKDGKKSSNLTNADVKTYMDKKPSASDFYTWATTNNLSPEQIALASDRPINEISKLYTGAKALTGEDGKIDQTKVDEKTLADEKEYFDEDAYLAAYPDVKREIETGKSASGQPSQFKTGYEHYLQYGKGSKTHLPKFKPGYTPPVAKANGGLMAMARGGMAQQFNLGDYSDGGRLLRGPGDGVSDSIPASIGGKRPARLADGEFVVPARIVSELGNGSTEAGARKLYAMMDRVQKARRGTVGKGRVAKNSRSDKYLPA
jgi:hypothetical protein